jgi:hypothetical protein
MTLPVIPLATDQVTLSDGSVVLVRGLSRTRAGRIAGGDFTGKLHDAEVFVLVNGAQVTEADAEVWLDATGPEDAGKVIDRILELSALKALKTDAPEEEEAPDPQ